MKVVAYVETNWNFLCALLYAQEKKVDELVIIKASGVSIEKYLKSEFYDIDLKVEDGLINTSVNYFSKILSLYKLGKNCAKIKNVDKFIKFTNFSPVVKYVASRISSKETILIDDGFLLYNAYHPEQKYNLNSLSKKIFYSLLGAGIPKFDFLDFSSVNEAYLVYSEQWKLVGLKKRPDKIFCFAEIYSLQKLRSLLEKYFSFSSELKEWEKTINSGVDLILGGAFVSHNLLSEEKYKKLLLSFNLQNNRAIYKSHPSEAKKLLSCLPYESFLFGDIPVEVFLAYSLPNRIYGFGSTTQFLVDYEGAKCENYFVLPRSVFKSEFLKDFSIFSSDCSKIEFFDI